VPADQTGPLKPGYDAAHGGGPDLLGIGQLAERSWPPKDQHGKGGKLCGAYAAFAVADAEAAEQVNRCGVELIGNIRW
jgi:hypothetical protein